MNKSFTSRLFYKNKHNQKEAGDNLTVLLLPSILGIILCAICLMGSTWAWFTATQSTETANIQSASYTITAEVLTENNLSIATENSATLQQGRYTVTLTAIGDASTGYCKVKIGSTEKLTQQFPSAKYPEKSITFTLVINEPARVEFIPCWGTSATDEAERILNGSTHTHGTAPAPQENPPAEEKDETAEPPADTTENTATEETTTPEATTPEAETKEILHTVTSNDTLFSIAQQYNTTVDKLQAYNNIENASHIEVGDIIKIPISE